MAKMEDNFPNRGGTAVTQTTNGVNTASDNKVESSWKTYGLKGYPNMGTDKKRVG